MVILQDRRGLGGRQYVNTLDEQKARNNYLQSRWKTSFLLPIFYWEQLSHRKSFTESCFLKLPNDLALLSPKFVVQLLNCVWLFATPWTTTRQASLSFTISQSLLKLMSIELVMPLNHLILCQPLLLLPSIISSIREAWQAAVHGVAKSQTQLSSWTTTTIICRGILFSHKKE